MTIFNYFLFSFLIIFAFFGEGFSFLPSKQSFQLLYHYQITNWCVPTQKNKRTFKVTKKMIWKNIFTRNNLERRTKLFLLSDVTKIDKINDSNTEKKVLSTHSSLIKFKLILLNELSTSLYVNFVLLVSIILDLVTPNVYE